MVNLGPGTLTFGEEGTEIDASCQVNNLRITVDKDQEDSTTKLCGTVKPGAVTYTYAMEGNLDTDVETAEGFFAFTQEAKGTEVPFTFTPNTEAGTTATGTVIIDPLEFGADEYGATLDSDIEFTLVGEPTYAYGTSGALTAAEGSAAARLLALVTGKDTSTSDTAPAAPKAKASASSGTAA